MTSHRNNFRQSVLGWYCYLRYFIFLAIRVPNFGWKIIDYISGRINYNLISMCHIIDVWICVIFIQILCELVCGALIWEEEQGIWDYLTGYHYLPKWKWQCFFYGDNQQQLQRRNYKVAKLRKLSNKKIVRGF